MSRRNSIIDFSRGMNNVAEPHLLKDSEAEQIVNLYLDKDGLWKDINNPEVMLNLSATHLATAIKVIQWKPTKVPSDCIDDFVYVVFCSDGVVKLVYRGVGELQVFTIDIKARLLGLKPTYYSVAVTGVTIDLNGNSDGMTSTSQFDSLSRVYLEGTSATMTVPQEAVPGKEFLHWIDEFTGQVIGNNRKLDIVVNGHMLAIAVYVTVPYISVMNEDNEQITELDEFTADPGEYSDTKIYYVAGVNLANPLRIYPPERFEISLNGLAWTSNPDYIELSAATANGARTAIHVRYLGSEEE